MSLQMRTSENAVQQVHTVNQTQKAHAYHISFSIKNVVFSVLSGAIHLMGNFSSAPSYITLLLMIVPLVYMSATLITHTCQ